jgi:hypothetical protein
VLLCRCVVFLPSFCLLNTIFPQLFPSKSERKTRQLPEMCLRKTAANDPSAVGRTHTSLGVRIFIIHPSGAAIKKAAAPRINT